MRILIPSYKRSHRLRTTEFLPKVADKVTLIVRPEEAKDYSSLGFDVCKLSRKAKDISSTRKEVGLIAADMGLDWFLMADDDLRILQRDAASLKLTPLADGRKLLSALGAALRTVPAAPEAHAIVMLDLNGFKKVNDIHGHRSAIRS